eukprot:jgi/Mesvir1/27058/Mv20752-RA.1
MSWEPVRSRSSFTSKQSPAQDVVSSFYLLPPAGNVVSVHVDGSRGKEFVHYQFEETSPRLWYTQGRLPVQGGELRNLRYIVSYNDGNASPGSAPPVPHVPNGSASKVRKSKEIAVVGSANVRHHFCFPTDFEYAGLREQEALLASILQLLQWAAHAGTDQFKDLSEKCDFIRDLLDAAHHRLPLAHLQHKTWWVAELARATIPQAETLDPSIFVTVAVCAWDRDIGLMSKHATGKALASENRAQQRADLSVLLKLLSTPRQLAMKSPMPPYALRMLVQGLPELVQMAAGEREELDPKGQIVPWLMAVGDLSLARAVCMGQWPYTGLVRS